MIKLNLLEIYINSFNKNNNNHKILKKLRNDLSKSFLNKVVEVELYPYKKIKFYNIKLGNYHVHEILFLEQELIQIFLYWKLNRQYKSFCDIGANTGIHSILASQIFNKVYSYEPIPIFFNEIKKNIEINKSKNVYVYKKAVSTSNKDTIIKYNYLNPTANHLIDSEIDSNYKKKYNEFKYYKVKSANFENILKKSEIFKIDVEGHEGEIISNLKVNIIGPKILFIEVHNKKNQIKVGSFLKKNKQFHIYNLNNLNKRITKIKEIPSAAKMGSIIFEKF